MTEWPSKRLADLCTPVGRRDPRDAPEAPFRYIDISSIDRSSKTITKPRTLKGGDAPSRARQVVCAGDVLVSTVRPNLNAVAAVPAELEPAVASTGFCVLRAKRDLADARYIFFQTRSPAFVEALSAAAKGGSYPAVSEADVREMRVPVPPLAEQRRIVQILDQADHLRPLRRKADLMADRLLPALFLREFGDPTTNPRNWRTRKIGDVCDVVSGGTPKTSRDEYWGGSVAWATPKDLSTLDSWVLRRTARTLTEEGLVSCASTMLPEEAVLLSSRAPIGLVAVSGVQVATNQGCKSFVCGSEIDPWYLFAWCKLQTSFLQALGHGATFKELSKRVLTSVSIPVPPMELQRRFRVEMEWLHSIRKRTRSADKRASSLFDQLLATVSSASGPETRCRSDASATRPSFDSGIVSRTGT